MGKFSGELGCRVARVLQENEVITGDEIQAILKRIEGDGDNAAASAEHEEHAELEVN